MTTKTHSMTATHSSNFAMTPHPFDKKTALWAFAVVGALHSLVLIGLANVADSQPHVLENATITPPLEISFITPAPIETAIVPLTQIRESHHSKDISANSTRVHPKSKFEATQNPMRATTPDKPLEETLEKTNEPQLAEAVRGQPTQQTTTPIVAIPTKQADKPVVATTTKSITITPTTVETPATVVQSPNRTTENATKQATQPATSPIATVSQIPNSVASPPPVAQTIKNTMPPSSQTTKAPPSTITANTPSVETKTLPVIKSPTLKPPISTKTPMSTSKSAAPATSNAPVNVGIGEAKFRVRPNFSECGNTLANGESQTLVFVFHVNKQGGLVNVELSRRSGNPTLNTQVLKIANGAKFYPYTPNGTPVAANFTWMVTCK